MSRTDSQSSVKRKSTFREYADAAVIAVVLALFIRTFVVQAFKIPSGSMKPTLLIGDHILVNKFIYGIRMPIVDRYLIRFEKPKRGDVVVFKWPRDESKDFIKRVIGVSGDKIEIIDDGLYINGQKIKTRYVDEYSDENIPHAYRYLEFLGSRRHFLLDVNAGRNHFGPYVVPENAIFVMGDNRDQSLDSRYWGFVSLNKIKGKAMIIYWSWPHWSRFLDVIR